MDAGVLHGIMAVSTGVVTTVGWVPAQVDASIAADVAGPVRAMVSFLAVLLVGVILRARFEGSLDRAVGDVMDRPRVAVVYGLFAYGMLVFAGLYVSDILLRTGTTGTPLGPVIVVLLLFGALAVSGVGFSILGTITVDYAGSMVADLGTGRRSWLDPALGATISTVPWIALPFTPAVAAWLALAAFGIGGRTRTWVHASRAEESDSGV